MQKNIPASLILLLFLVLPATAHTAAGDQRQTVEAAMQSYARALQSGTPEAIARHYTLAGELWLPGLAALRGREAIRAFLEPLTAATEVESVKVETTLLEVNGASASQWGTYRQVAGEKGKAKQTYTGRYAALWHREQGEWRLARLMMQPML